MTGQQSGITGGALDSHEELRDPIFLHGSEKTTSSSAAS